MFDDLIDFKKKPEPDRNVEVEEIPDMEPKQRNGIWKTSIWKLTKKSGNGWNTGQKTIPDPDIWKNPPPHPKDEYGDPYEQIDEEKVADKEDFKEIFNIDDLYNDKNIPEDDPLNNKNWDEDEDDWDEYGDPKDG